MRYQRIKLIMLNIFVSFIAFFLEKIPIAIPKITIKITKICLMKSISLFKGHLIKNGSAIPETTRKIKPSQIRFTIEGKIFPKTFTISLSLFALREIIVAIVAPPNPKANPTKCKKLKSSSYIIYKIRIRTI